jgi:acyltransferase
MDVGKNSIESPFQETTGRHEKGNRLTVIDILRGITIILVVAGHTEFTPAWANDLLRNFRMPLFFLVTGYLFSATNYFHHFNRLVSNRFLSILIPYFSAAIFFYIFWFCRQWAENDWDLTWYKPLIGIIYGVEPGGWLVINGPLWFLVCLFAAHVIFCLSMRYVHTCRLPYQAVCFFTLGIVGFLVSKLFYLPWSLDVALVVQPFVFIGYQLKQFKAVEKLTPNFLLTLLMLVIFAGAVYFNPPIDINNRVYGSLPLFYIGGIAGSILVIQLTKWLSRFKWSVNILSYVGRESLAVLINHSFFLLVIELFEARVFQSQLHWTGSTVIAIVGSLCINVVVKRIPVLNFLLNGKKMSIQFHKGLLQVKQQRV